MPGRTLIRYTIPLEDSHQQAHRLGINALAIDSNHNGTLYTAGRDGIIAAWDLQMSLSQIPDRYDDEEVEVQVDQAAEAVHKRSIQAHTNWVNDIGISSNRQCIFSCSSDTAVKVWRPNAFESEKAQTIGTHTDYIKCLTVPKFSSDWIATAGLDRSIVVWDAHGHGEKLCINDKSQHGTMKQSIYSIANGPNLLITGGIEKVMRVWDTRAGTRITKLVGHTDNVRSILCSDDGRRVVSASSDSTIKIWDLVAGRCLQTLSVHSDPVWTLLSRHPNLMVFHAGDKAGLVSRTDLRPTADAGGECTAIFREKSGINKLATIGDQMFAATARSDLNRWRDLGEEGSDLLSMHDPDAINKQPLESFAKRRLTSQTNGARRPSFVKNPPTSIRLNPMQFSVNGARRSSMWSAQSVVSLALDEDTKQASNFDAVSTLRTMPESTVSGQAGLVSHLVLADRTRVLTSDSNGYVRLWDITTCKQLKTYGKVRLEDIQETLNTTSVIGSWCSVNTKVGALTVELDPRSMFDAETYFDVTSGYEASTTDIGNQRYNVGKWVVKNLFQGLIDAELETDKIECSRVRHRPGRLDFSMLNSKSDQPKSPTFGSKNPYAASMSPGTSIGLATPMPIYSLKTPNANHTMHSLQSSQTTPASPRSSDDYFSQSHEAKDSDPSSQTSSHDTQPNMHVPRTPGGSLMKNMKWLRSSKSTKPSSDTKSDTPTAANPAPLAEMQPQNFSEFVDQQRQLFATKQEMTKNAKVDAGPAELSRAIGTWIKEMDPMPEVALPQSMQITLADFQPGEGEAKDIYCGPLRAIRQEHDIIKRIAPAWLAQVLLLNEIPQSMSNIEANKHYFSFLPHPKSSLPDPFNTSKTSLMRLGAARSLRIRKALTYISQRLPSELVEKEGKNRPEEEWLEVVVESTVVEPTWTLLMTRRHLWKQGGDMKLEYRLKREH